MVRPTEGKNAKVISINTYEEHRHMIDALMKKGDYDGQSDLIRKLIETAYNAENITTTAIEVEPETFAQYLNEYKLVKGRTSPRTTVEYEKVHTQFIRFNVNTALLFPGKQPEAIYKELELIRGKK